MYIRQTKNDSKDSYIIAQIMRFGEYSATSLSEENSVALRQLSRYCLALVDACGDCKRRVIALLDQVFPSMISYFRIHSEAHKLSCFWTVQHLKICSLFQQESSQIFLTKQATADWAEKRLRNSKLLQGITFGIAFANTLFLFKSNSLCSRLFSLKISFPSLKNRFPIYSMKQIST